MQFTINRDALLKPLQVTSGVVDRKQTMPVLGNLLLVVSGDQLAVTATDLEIETIAYAQVLSGEEGSLTIPAKKFADICRMLPDGSTIQLKLENGRVIVRAGRSRFALATLPAEGFPTVETGGISTEFLVPQKRLRSLIERTQFAMAQQDVRYYLNGLLFEVGSGVLRTVATDGHRLAVCELKEDIKINENQQVIIPRKGVTEILKLLDSSDSPVTVQLGSNYIRIGVGDVTFTSKLIDGRFPDYQRVLPQGGDKIVVADRSELSHALNRISILSNERYRSVRFALEPGLLKISTNNPEQEEAEEELAVDYNGGHLEIGFNANYVVEALGAIPETDIKMVLSDANSCCLVRGLTDDAAKYVVMPMRL